MERFVYYKYAYVFSLPVFLIALFWYPLVYLCAALFFASSVWLIIEQTRIQQYLDSSAATHYEINSRFNLLNYAIAGYVIVAALLSALIFHPFLILIMWTGIIIALQILIPRYLPRLHLHLIADYIMNQLPDINPQVIEAIIYAKIQHPELTEQVIEQKWQLELPVVSSILGYYENYLQRNSEMFNFVPAFIRQAGEFQQHLNKQPEKNESTQPEATQEPPQPQQ